MPSCPRYSITALVSVSFDHASPPLSLPSDLLLLAVFDSALSRDDTSAANFTGFAADASGGAELASLDVTLSGALTELASDLDFRAKPGHVSQVLRFPGQPFKRVVLLGLGKPDVLLKGEAGSWQGLGSAIASAAKTNQASKVSLAFLGKPEAAEGQEIKVESAVRGIGTGAIVGSFEDVRLKSEEMEKAKAQRGVKELQVVGLGDAESLQKDVFETAPHADVLSARVLEKDECAALGMGSYLAVEEASAADSPPKFIHVTYTPLAAADGQGAEEKPLKKLALIGKGLTFDRVQPQGGAGFNDSPDEFLLRIPHTQSLVAHPHPSPPIQTHSHPFPHIAPTSGGYNLKAGPGSMIHLMKFDMGGAAAVLGAAKAIAAIQPQGVQVHFIIAACENMVSGGGMKPGDIITASNGKTIEVAASELLRLWLDSCLFTPSDELLAELEASSKACGDKVLCMPMEEA
ncbi:unnamed protein product [Closterium sp. NIES-65]|nr:unnamed protein product [Closterium sp. NIES-65]